MARFIKTKYLAQYTKQKYSILINIDEIVCVKRGKTETCLVTMAHADDNRRCSFEIDMPFDELWRQLRTCKLVAEP
jgi:hypothetical protein